MVDRYHNTVLKRTENQEGHSEKRGNIFLVTLLISYQRKEGDIIEFNITISGNNRRTPSYP